MPNTKMGPMQRYLLAWLQNNQAPTTEVHGYSITHLEQLTPLDYRQLESAISRLKRRGYVEEYGTLGNRKVWKLTKEGRSA